MRPPKKNPSMDESLGPKLGFVVQRELNMEYAFYGVYFVHTVRTELTKRSITRYSILLLVIGLITYMSHFSRSGLGVLGGFLSWETLCW